MKLVKLKKTTKDGEAAENPLDFCADKKMIIKKRRCSSDYELSRCFFV